MIRLLILTLLLCITPTVIAQTLYKWVESDGSITFAVEPPPNGIEYETIKPGTSAVKNKHQPLTVSRSASASSAKPSEPLIVKSEPEQRVAPQAGANSALSKSAKSVSTSMTGTGLPAPQLGSALGTPGHKTDVQVTPTATMSRKQQQCEDLKKRVVSLERRLTTRLTPEDMDNTVVHMARYQRSYDHHCVQ